MSVRKVIRPSIVVAAMAAIAAVTAGCNPDQGAPPDANPGDTAKNAAANIDKQIEIIKNNPSMPADAKARAIEGLERGKNAAGTASNTKTGPPTGGKP